MEKLIDYRLFNPVQALFKQNKNDRAEFTKVFCSNSENCEAYKTGCCIMWSGLLGKRCPYGRKIKETGYTPRAKSFSDWLLEKKKTVDGMRQLSPYPNKMCKVGEYVYFPYNNWSLGYNIDIENKYKDSFFVTGEKFFPQEMFTIEFIQMVIMSRPQAMMGGEITSYQKEVVPIIVQHFEEVFPEMFSEWKEKHPNTAKRFEKKDYVGREAFLKTLKPGCKIEHKDGNGTWDGSQIIVPSYHGVFLPIKKIENASLYIKPRDETTIKITSNDQVFELTKFKD